MKQNNRKMGITIGLLLTFVLWTVLITNVDVRAIGPRGTLVGFSTLNQYFHKLTGVHMNIYTITDLLGLIPLGFVLGFGVLGLVQLIRRKSLFKVDSSILVLGGFYVVVMLVYLVFEIFIINYRPILIEGNLEASYPSSTTMLVMCVMPTAIMQFNSRISKGWLRVSIACVLTVFTVFMVIARLVAGVHWFTDIIGGALLSAFLVMLYDSVIVMIGEKQRKKQ